MPADALYAACYDVSADAERARVAKVLEGYGSRVQGSVFECRLTRSARERLLGDVRALDLKTGFLLLYALRPGARRHTVGALPVEPFAEERFGLVV